MKSHLSPVIHKRKKTIEFSILNSCAHHISLAGSFNKWAKDEFPLKKRKDGKWIVQIPMPPQGRYKYKFFIDNQMAAEDIENPRREPDGIGGFYSVLEV